MLARLARPNPMWIVISAAWIAATLALGGLGLYDLATGARTLGQSLFVLLAGRRLHRLSLARLVRGRRGFAAALCRVAALRDRQTLPSSARLS